MSESRSRMGRAGRAGALVLSGALAATVLTGVSWADSGEADPGASGQGLQEGPPGQAMGERGPKGPGAGPVLHGEQVIRTPDGEYREIVVQNGEITAVSNDSITVTSEDGYERSYGIDADTVIRIDREESGADGLATGRPGRVVADIDGTASLVATMTAEGEAERQQHRSEGRERREERREMLQEFRQWRQGADEASDA